MPRPLPDGFPAHAWRCAGQGAARRCEARSAQAGEFRCDDQRCVQERPRAPDAGEWLCTELDSAVYCLGVINAAGIEPGTRDPAFACGTRRGHAAPICVDFNPDQPPQQPAWRCRFRYETGAAKRVCEPPQGTPAPRLGAACKSTQECPRAALCADGFCLPPRPEPACWLDADCGDAAQCVWGSCRAKGGA